MDRKQTSNWVMYRRYRAQSMREAKVKFAWRRKERRAIKVIEGGKVDGDTD